MSKINISFPLKDVPILPIKDEVIFPKSIVPILIGRQISINAINIVNKESSNLHNTICVVTQKNNTEDVTGNDLFDVGVLSKILQIIPGDNNTLKVLIEGITRVKVANVSLDQEGNKFLKGDLEVLLPETQYTSIELEALWRVLHTNYEKLREFDQNLTDLLIPNSFDIFTLEILVDGIVESLDLGIEDEQFILSTQDIHSRIKKINTYIIHEIEILKTENSIRKTLQEQIDASQKEYYLNEQIKAIQKELKKNNHDYDVLEDFLDKGEEIGIPEGEQFDKFEKEVNRLKEMPHSSPEASIIRNYIDCVLSLPWDAESSDAKSIKDARDILNKNHFGLQKVKERIVEIIAALKFTNGEIKSPIMCLVGPPGVGKTSLGKSIALALSREFQRIALGGLRDEAEIRGHRRTYVGAMPGKIISAMKKCETINPVIMLDEIDKMTHDSHGDPASALLEVLDPEQNNEFVDNYLDMAYDLSKVLFITTANTIDSIPLPLLDRMEIIQLSGYTLEEKLQIAKQFIVPKQILDHKINTSNEKKDSLSNQFKIDILDEAITYLIQQYTREAGVRQLDRFINRIIEKTITKYFEESETKKIKKNNKKVSRNIKNKDIDMFMYTITKNTIHEMFKNPPFPLFNNKIKHRIGIATGLAWTEVGGDVLDVEVAIVPGKGNVLLTGQLGEIMQESAQAALTYIKTIMKELNINKTVFSSSDIHIHIPEGATPKDGPSAGITMCAALISALCKIPTNQDVAMTGEITLQGRILEIGGLKEKLLAALVHRYTTVLIPDDNKKIVEEIREEIDLKKIKIHFVKTMNDALPFIFKDLPQSVSSK
jgi:ATP-dependent Lon protease